jgi:hypothetical protein
VAPTRAIYKVSIMAELPGVGRYSVLLVAPTNCFYRRCPSTNVQRSNKSSISHPRWHQHNFWLDNRAILCNDAGRRCGSDDDDDKSDTIFTCKNEVPGGEHNFSLWIVEEYWAVRWQKCLTIIVNYSHPHDPVEKALWRTERINTDSFSFRLTGNPM